ncbi:MAG: hypothetical protein H6948_15225 [Zoogloeaceae bacterium]|nr:hypothetical protein [Zoogloeaceae bacterium]
MTIAAVPISASPIASSAAPPAPVPVAQTWPLLVTVSAGPVAQTTPLMVTVALPPAVVTQLLVKVVTPSPAQTIPLRVSVFTPGASPARWRPVVTLGGVDVSARLVGVVEVVATESEARIASFSLLPSPGTVAPADWVGKAVAIDFAGADAGGNPINVQRLFTGVVDVPEYSINTGIATFECTDQRQEVLANTPRAWFDAAIGGYYADAVAGAPVDNLQYAEARLASTPQALELDAWGSPRVTPWHLTSVYASLGAADILDGSLSASLPSRADLRNMVETTFEYRFTRLRSRTIMGGWHLAGDYRAKENLPTKAMVEQALDGMAGWQRMGNVGYQEPPHGSQNWNGGIYYMAPEVANQLCISFASRHMTRWAQTVTERYTIRVTNAASVAAIGPARDTTSGGVLTVDYDSSQWLNDYSTAPALTRLSAGDESHDVGFAGVSDRATAAANITALVARAQVRVQASHRAGRARFAVPLRADYSLAHRFAIDAPLADGRRLQAAGKAVEVSHLMDIDAGEATTTVALAISGHATVGLQPYDPPAAPAQPADPTPAPAPAAYGIQAGTFSGRRVGAPAYNQDTMIGFSTNNSADDSQGVYSPTAELYPVQFSVGSPDIESPARDPLELASTIEFAVDVPQDPFEVTA